ncbi:TauD/TfdA dioxygenase family protein [Rhodococcus opacus]|uniref:TauD/TfdA dioxygenase family protein n=1 Tax=Rhodococcus opacus TaxID=37919 RepID=UPI001C479133|nr:TauD/TfdA family dioxygenase [Rhodococcus opacus]MBV6760721.1 TauD/TfdA family dioxygenase [Rhodococcus opacus]
MTAVTSSLDTLRMVRTGADPLKASGPLVARPPADTSGYSRITVEPVAPTIGADIAGVRLSGSLDDETMAEIRRALTDWKVLFFRDQDISRDDHRAFAARWGELEQHPFFKHMMPGQSDVDVATFAKNATTAGYENNWHNDVTWHEYPSFAAVLRAVEIPAVGGDTLWADTGAAYDLLPQDIKDEIDNLTAEHDWINSFGRLMDPDVVAKLRPEFPAIEHPVVRVIPETGRRALFVNVSFTQRILGMSTQRSDELLRLLYRHVMRPEFQVRLRWRKNTIAFWDNRACQHYASSDYHPNQRMMERISIVGDRPVGIGV